MPDYRRAFAPGGTFFFTLVTFGRAPILLGDAARLALRRAVERTRRDHPFALDAIVVLPDHLHAVWTLPEGDADFSTRWRLIKSRFTREWLTTEAARADGAASRPLARASRGERAVWQPRYWEHLIRDEGDLARHLDYVHYNPV
jgi:putative transposase